MLAVHCCFLASFPETIAHLHRVQLFLSFSPLKLLLFTPSLQMFETCLELGDQLLYYVTSVWGAPVARHLYDTWRKDFDGLKYTLSLVIKIYFCGGKN